MTQVLLVDAFTTKAFRGNPAGVVPDANGLTSDQMQQIANELHASETAFVLAPSDDEVADYRIRYFTPTAEVDLCGHATIGTVCSLVEHQRLMLSGEEGVCRLETNVGILAVRYGRSGGQVWAEMEQASPRFRAIELDIEQTAGLLGIDSNEIDESLPCGLAFTGLWDLFVPIRTRAAMAAMRPDFSGIAEWNEMLDVISTHVYTRETLGQENHYHARDFSPRVGINEDPATGTASGAMAALLHDKGFLKASESIRIEQGFEIGRDSIITARVESAGSDVRVYVGGQARTTLVGEIRLT